MARVSHCCRYYCTGIPDQRISGQILAASGGLRCCILGYGLFVPHYHPVSALTQEQRLGGLPVFLAGAIGQHCGYGTVVFPSLALLFAPGI